MSVKDAMLKHHAGLLRKEKARRKNKTPEKDVQHDCVRWLMMNNFTGHIYEAKGGYNNTYGIIAVIRGHSDWAGCDEMGRAVYVEFKAKGKLSTLREHQRNFLIDKIESNAFAVCVDSMDILSRIYSVWNGLVSDRHFERARKFLMDSLPKQKVSIDQDLFPQTP